jgi:hypothetical protein
MKFRVVLIGSISAVAISASTLAASAACSDDRYACEPTAAADSAAAEPLALQPQTRQATPRKIRSLAERRAAREARAQRRAARRASRSHVADDMEKAPPDAPRELEKAPPDNTLPAGTLGWAPMETPDAAATAPFEALIDPSGRTDPSARITQPERAEVRVVAPEELNDVDRSAPPPVKVVPVRFEASSMPAGPQQEVSATTPAAPANTALLERVLVTFGGAFGAASAMRLFLG